MTSSPRFTVTVTNQTRGWTYTATEGDAATNVPTVQLADPLDYAWGMAGEQLPGTADPCESSVRLWARDSSYVPPVERGDRVTIDVRMGVAGPRVLRPAAMKVTGAEVEVRKHPHYAALLTLRLVDALAELPPQQPKQGMVGLQGITGYNTAHQRWRTRFAELANRIGRTIGAPSWWPDDERPAETVKPAGAGNLLRGLDQPKGLATGELVGSTAVYLYPWSAAETLQRLVRSHNPATLTHALVAGWQDAAATFPAGWRRIGPDTYWGSFNDSPGSAEAFAEPQTSDRYYVVPASRKVSTASYLHAVLGTVAGVLTLLPNPTASNPTGHRPLGLDAGWCELPATFRKAREHAINYVTVLGQESVPAFKDSGRDYANAAAQLADGTVSRDVATSLDLGDSGDSPNTVANRFSSVEAPLIGASYLTDDSARTSWTPDAFTVRASLMSDAAALSVLPRLCPRQPGETDGDGQLIRHVVLYRLPTDKRLNGAPVVGFLVAGKLTITGGDLVFTLTLTPGQPQYGGAVPTPVTFAEFEAKAAGLTMADVDPRITYAELDYVDS